jgi:cyanate lyase
MNAKEAKGLSFAEIAEEVGRHEVWVATALLGQTSMDGEEADAVAKVLDLDPDVVAALKAIPMRGAFDGAVPTDPLLYRLFEIIQVYGPACKAVIHEKFGDGIMSAIDFELDIARLADSRGDRVLMTLNGKFLPYRSW